MARSSVNLRSEHARHHDHDSKMREAVSARVALIAASPLPRLLLRPVACMDQSGFNGQLAFTDQSSEQTFIR